MELANKTAVVVNGDVAPGPHIVRSLAEAGANVAVHAGGPAADLRWAADLARDSGPPVTTIRASLEDLASVRGMMEDVKRRHGRIDVLVYVARPKSGNNLRSIDLAQWRADVDDDLKGLFHCAKEISKIMVAQKSGRIIPVFFGVGARGEAELLSWSACTGGIAGFVKCLALELVRFNVGVNCVAYGLMDDVDYPFMTRRTLKQYLEVLGVPQTGTAADVAAAVRFLASDGAAYVTGQNVYVNGGLLL